MTVALKKIKRDKFKDAIDTVVNNFNTNGEISIDENYLNSISEDVFVNSKPVNVHFDIDGYDLILNEEGYTYNKLAKIGMKLHKEMVDVDGKTIPKYIYYEKEVWAYLSLTVFKNIVKQLRLDDDDKITEKKINNIKNRFAFPLVYD